MGGPIDRQEYGIDERHICNPRTGSDRERRRRLLGEPADRTDLGPAPTLGPVAAAAALKAIEIYQRENLFDHAAKVGAYMQARLREFEDHPLVGEVRGKGLIAAIELVANKERRGSFADGKVGAAAKQFCQDNGLLIRAVSGNCIAFCPPLVIAEGQIDEMIEMFAKGLEQTEEFVRKNSLAS